MVSQALVKAVSIRMHAVKFQHPVVGGTIPDQPQECRQNIALIKLVIEQK
jgi:hypothetical protein